MPSWESGSLLVMIRGFWQCYKGAELASEVLGPGLSSCGLGQDSAVLSVGFSEKGGDGGGGELPVRV